MIPYVSLHNHTTFSIGDCILKPLDLFQSAKELQQPAVAITDHGSLGAVHDSLKASRSTGVKLIVGCEFYFAEDAVGEGNGRLYHLVLLAKNATGYRNLLTLNKRGFDDDRRAVIFKKATSRIDWKLLEEHCDGLICTTACGNGIVGQAIMADDLDAARAYVKRLQNIFGADLALELQPHNLQRREGPYSGPIDQRKINRGLKKLGEELGVRCIVATDAHYLPPEQHDDHDVFICISTGHPKSSGQRLRYDKPDFHVKSAIEVGQYFIRHRQMWGEDFVKDLFANTLYFADKCEFPDWIDPKFSNPTGKELPEFPVSQQPDYEDFLEWKAEYPENGLADDVLYYRYGCERGLRKKLVEGRLDAGMLDEYQGRIKEELDVLEYHGFSSYMLIVADYVNWARNNGVAVGPGRGCLTEDTKVLTTRGFKRLPEVEVGDYVFTHTGERQEVLNKFSYDVDEEGVEIGTDLSFGPIRMTSDHKVYACKAEETEQYIRLQKAGSPSIHKVKRWKEFGTPSWISAGELSVNDAIFMPFPMNPSHQPDRIDLWKYLDKNAYSLESYKPRIKTVDRTVPAVNQYSIRAVSRTTGLQRNVVKNALAQKATKKTNRAISEYLAPFSMTLDDWRKLNNTRVVKFPRYIEFDTDFCYFLGRWVGDGWITYHSSGAYLTGFAFHKDDESGIKRIQNYLEHLGFTVARRDANDKKLVQLIVREKLLFCLLERLFPHYVQTSQSKHLPEGFRTWDTMLLLGLINGLIDSDGSVEFGKRQLVRENIDTTSERLAEEIKELLLYLKIPSSVSTREPYERGEYLCSRAYKVRFKGINTLRSWRIDAFANGYWCRIYSLAPYALKRVYDIKVAFDHSYLTTNYAVHNSVGGCFTAYLHNIHCADPFKYGMIFSRFHNKQKTSFPDIDLDFAPSGREKVQNYIRRKYGDDYVAHVSNINTITPKVYAKDISRVFEFGDMGRSVSAEIGDAIADSIPADIKTVKQALEKAPLFAEYAKQYPQLARYAETIGGRARAWGTHAGGVVIGSRPLTGLVPVRRDAHGQFTLEYEKERAEECGLVKMDTLGLETLDIIEKTYELIKENGKTPPSEPFDYEQPDKKTYDLISKGDTFCVFQLAGVAIPVCKLIKPTNVYEIALITALIRPAAKEIIPEFVKVRDGEKPLELLHPNLQRAFGKTYGFGLFEECLMYLAQDIAGWDLHKADDLRKMTKAKGKYPDKVKKLREDFISDGQTKKNLDEELVTKIWDDVVAGFGGYGFNIPHAVLYSMISFHTAYLKANFKLEFLVANLMSEVRSNQKQAKDNITRIKDEIRAGGVKIVPPNINRSDMSFKIIDDNTLMTGLDALKYMGKDAIPELVAKRPYKDFKDLMYRVSPGKVRAPTIQALAVSGALDEFGLSRKKMFLYASDYREKLRTHMSRLEKEWAKLHDKGEVKTAKPSEEARQAHLDKFEYPFPKEREWNVRELFALEEYYMGEGITGSVFERYNGFLRRNVFKFDDLPRLMPYERRSDDERTDRKRNTYNLITKGLRGLKGVITSMFVFKVKKEDSVIFGQEMCRLQVQDPWGGELSVIAFPKGWEAMQQRIHVELSGGKHHPSPGLAIFFRGSFQWENAHTYSFILDDILDYKPSPTLPEDLKSRKVKMPRVKKITKKDIDDLEKDELAEEMEEEMIDAGVAPVDDKDDFDGPPDPFTE